VFYIYWCHFTLSSTCSNIPPFLLTSEDTASSEWGVRTKWSMNDEGDRLELCQKVRMQGNRGGKEGDNEGRFDAL